MYSVFSEVHPRPLPRSEPGYHLPHFQDDPPVSLHDNIPPRIRTCKKFGKLESRRDGLNVAGGGAGRNPRNMPPTRPRPGGTPEIRVVRKPGGYRWEGLSRGPPGRLDTVCFSSGGSALLHPRLRSPHPSGISSRNHKTFRAAVPVQHLVLHADRDHISSNVETS